jgi:hypothetical protein
MKGSDGHSIFGAIEQSVERYRPRNADKI